MTVSMDEFCKQRSYVGRKICLVLTTVHVHILTRNLQLAVAIEGRQFSLATCTLLTDCVFVLRAANILTEEHKDGGWFIRLPGLKYDDFIRAGILRAICNCFIAAMVELQASLLWRT